MRRKLLLRWPELFILRCAKRYCQCTVFAVSVHAGEALNTFFACHLCLGTAAIVGALSLNSVVGMTMMHPVEWHAKNPEEVRAERAREKEQKVIRELTLSNRRSTIDVIHSSSKAKWSSLRSLKEERGAETPLLIEALKVT